MKITWWILGQLGALMLILLAACTIETTSPPLPSSPISSATPSSENHPVEVAPVPERESHHQTLPPPVQTETTSTSQYDFDVKLDYDAKQLNVVQTISYTNFTHESFIELPILVPPAYQPGVFFLNSIQTDQTYPIKEAMMDHALIHLMLETPLDPGDHIEISLDFELHLKQGGMAFGYTDRQMLLADWYPLIPPYQEGVGWMINPPGLVGEYLVYPSSHFDLNLCLAPSGQSLVVAASAPLADDADDCYRYRSEDRRNISLAISPYYQVSTAAEDGVTVITYTFPEHAGLGTRAADLAVLVWTTFTDLYGDNQRAFLSIIEADIFDGLETDGLIYISEWYYLTADPTPQNYFELLIVHETAHQWFYGLIHNDQANQPWLDEALATYSEVLFYEIHHPKLVDWWWDYRVATYAPEGAVNATIYDFNQYRPYINAVYLQGATFLQALRNTIGEEAFFTGLLDYIQTKGTADNIRKSGDFLDSLTQGSDVDISPLILEFFQ